MGQFLQHNIIMGKGKGEVKKSYKSLLLKNTLGQFLDLVPCVTIIDKDLLE